MNSADFDTWIMSQMETSADAGFCQSVVTRLKAEQITSEASIFRCVEKTASIEMTAKAGHLSFNDTFAFIDKVLPHVTDDPLLKAKLFQRKGTLLLQLGDFQGASQQFSNALTYADSARLDEDKYYVQTQVYLGQSLLSQGKKREAEQYFLEALSYPYYTIVHHADEMQQMRDLYVAAGRGLIDARRNDLAALKSIVFVPSALEELGPVLNTAIQDASR